jgi:hypothetical protein
MTSAQAIEDIMAHLGAILMQASATDDAIILEHVRAAHKIARDEYQTNAINSHKHLGVRS